MNLTQHEMNFWGGKEGGLAPGRSRWLRHRKKSYLMVMAKPSPWHGHQSLIGRWLRHRQSQVCYNAITPRWWIVFHHAIARWLFWAWSLFLSFWLQSSLFRETFEIDEVVLVVLLVFYSAVWWTRYGSMWHYDRTRDFCVIVMSHRKILLFSKMFVLVVLDRSHFHISTYLSKFENCK